MEINQIQEDSFDATHDELSKMSKVINMLERPNYFPNLVQDSTFLNTVLSRVGNDLSKENVVQIAFEVAKYPQFQDIIPTTGLFRQKDGSFSKTNPITGL